MNFYLLWTDACLLLVVFLGLIFLIYGMQKPQLRHAFKNIVSRPISAGAGVVLLFFLIIGVLDSINIKHQTKSESLLDLIVAPLGDSFEKTYSAPLALTLFTSENAVIDGVAHQIHPQLKYPPANMKTDSQKRRFVWLSVYKSAAISIFMVFLIWVLGLLRKDGSGVMPSSAQIAALLVLFLCLFFLLSGYFISRDLHLLGTGKIGQDIFYYALKSIHTGLVIGILTTLFMMPLALALGIAAGYFGGIVDDIIQYIYTTLSSIPGVLLITASVLSMQTYIANHPERFTTLAQTADARLLALCFILGVTSWTSLCRLLRAESLKLREIDFVLAAKSLGTSNFKILYKHLLPNLMHIVVITLVLDFSFLVLAEAVLAYVGVGVSPMTISWGNMINAARLELAREPVVWWPMFAAFIFMFTLVLASNLFADAVRDAFDPRHNE